MTTSSRLRRLRGRLQAFLKARTPTGRLAPLLSPHLPPVICVDVGASYFPHPNWSLFLQSPATRWVVVEPNSANVSYVNSWPWPCSVSTFTSGLSGAGGTRTLYVTNVDSGSSLLEPVIPPSLTHRLPRTDYFFPYRRQTIETLTLAKVLELQPPLPVLVKLDTQGTELDILSGAEELFEHDRIAGIEMEATLLAQPVMQGAGKFWEACRFLEGRGFELLLISPIYGPSRLAEAGSDERTFLNECDAVFTLRPDVARTLGVEARLGLLAFYLSYAFYEESLSLLDADDEARTRLAASGCDLTVLRSTIHGFATHGPSLSARALRAIVRSAR